MQEQTAGRLAGVGDAAQTQHVFPFLLFERHARRQAGVDHEGVALARFGRTKPKVEGQRLQVLPILGAQGGDVAAPVLVALLVAFVAVREGEGIVVPEHGEDAVLAGKLHHALGIGALGHQIAGQHDAVAFRVPAPAQQELQLIGTAVNIANDDGPLHRSELSYQPIQELLHPGSRGRSAIDNGCGIAQISPVSTTVDTRSRRLRVLGQSEALAADARPHHPPWIRARLPSGPVYFDLRERVHALGLHTVCESASCPNVGECWSAKSLTIMILGGLCTRSCKFCDVPTGRPLPPDAGEPERVATMLAERGLAHTVITCVTRDDLADGGAAHWAATIRAVKERCPAMVLEALVSDFKGDTHAVDTVLDAGPDVFAHNLETVPRLSRQVRVQASVERSLHVLDHASQRGALTKSGLMLGLGETLDEIRATLRDLRAAGVAILTLGQYLRPSRQHLPVERHVTPDEFRQLKDEALAMGFAHVESGPLVRSSYHASNQHDLVEQWRRRTG